MIAKLLLVSALVAFVSTHLSGGPPHGGHGGPPHGGHGGPPHDGPPHGGPHPGGWKFGGPPHGGNRGHGGPPMGERGGWKFPPKNPPRYEAGESEENQNQDCDECENGGSSESNEGEDCDNMFATDHDGDSDEVGAGKRNPTIVVGAGKPEKEESSKN